MSDENKEVESTIEVVVDNPDEGQPQPSGATEGNQQPAAAQEKPAAGGDEELERHSESVKKRIDKLTGRWREAERREQAAVEYAKSVQADREKMTEYVRNLEIQNLNEFKARLQAQDILLRNDLQRSIERGDTEGQAKITVALATLANEQQRAANMEARLGVQRQQPPQRTQPPAQQPQQGQQPGMRQPPAQQPPQPTDPKADAWTQRNTWFGTNEPMTLTAFSIHRALVEDEGYDPSNDDYYEELDKRMREEFPHKFKPVESGGQTVTLQPQAQNRRLTSTVAPAIRNLPGAAGKPVTQVKLTRSQLDIAKRLGVTPEAYAKELVKLNRES